MKNEDGTWNLIVDMEDTFDFTDLQNPFFETIEVEQPKLGKKDKRLKPREDLFHVFGWAANDAACISQKLGAITPFDVKIHFTVANFEVKREWLTGEEWDEVLGGLSQWLFGEQ